MSYPSVTELQAKTEANRLARIEEMKARFAGEAAKAIEQAAELGYYQTSILFTAAVDRKSSFSFKSAARTIIEELRSQGYSASKALSSSDNRIEILVSWYVSENARLSESKAVETL